MPFTGLCESQALGPPLYPSQEHSRKRALRKESGQSGQHSRAWRQVWPVAPCHPCPYLCGCPGCVGTGEHFPGMWFWFLDTGLLLSFRALVQVSVCCRTNCTPPQRPHPPTLSHCLSEKPTQCLGAVRISWLVLEPALSLAWFVPFSPIGRLSLAS